MLIINHVAEGLYEVAIWVSLLLGERRKKKMKQQSLQLQSPQSQSFQLQTAYQSLQIVTNVSAAGKKGNGDQVESWSRPFSIGCQPRASRDPVKS